jgi:hypothetical protein
VRSQFGTVNIWCTDFFFTEKNHPYTNFLQTTTV